MKPPDELVRRSLTTALDKAVGVHQPVVDAYLRRARQ